MGSVDINPYHTLKKLPILPLDGLYLDNLREPCFFFLSLTISIETKVLLSKDVFKLPHTVIKDRYWFDFWLGNLYSSLGTFSDNKQDFG